jgi:hypothetical protein
MVATVAWRDEMQGVYTAERVTRQDGFVYLKMIDLRGHIADIIFACITRRACSE